MYTIKQILTLSENRHRVLLNTTNRARLTIRIHIINIIRLSRLKYSILLFPVGETATAGSIEGAHRSAHAGERTEVHTGSTQ